ncbi:Fc.00g095220.m01.CDS01 [Cosmosporella sp. VM-42]
MLRRPPGEGRRSQQQKLLLAFAFFLLPWFPLVSAQQQHRPAPESPLPNLHRPGGSSQQLSDDDAVHNWAATPIEAAEASRETTDNLKRSSSLKQRQQQAINRKNRKHEYDNIIIPDDASALATLAPAQSVRAPHPSRHQRPSSVPASGLTSPQNARSLKDWEVEDFVLLATVDGDLYASERRTGKERWHLEVDQPMIETKHHRANQSVLDDDYHPVDHYIWVVEPNRDGGLYVWIPDSGAGLVRTGFTMKKLVEELAPYADEEPPVIYTGDKKTTMVTLDAATGRVLKWFGSGGSHVNEAESCLRPNALYDSENEECSSTGTITLGRSEYTVGIQRRDGRPIATLKYTEWTPNNFDNDLYQQHHTSLDSWYITGQHDGRLYAFDYARSRTPSPSFAESFSAPVARVFDVCRPWDATLESNPDLIVLPQPPMPSQDETIARMRSNSIFLNQTRSGSWYAMSGRAYPLIIDAPAAQLSRPEWWEMEPPWDTISQSRLSKALVGTHFLESLPGSNHQPATLPGGSFAGEYDDLDNESLRKVPAPVDDEPNIIAKVKSLPQGAANSVIEFISNPILIIICFLTLMYNEKNIRQAIIRMRNRGVVNQLQDYFAPDPLSDGSVGHEYSDSEELTSQPPKEVVVEVNIDDDSKTPKVVARVEEKNTAQELTPRNDGAVATKSLGLSEEARPRTPVTQKQPTNKGIELKQSEEPQTPGSNIGLNGAPAEKKKKAHRGRRGGIKHRKKGTQEQGQTRDDETAASSDEAIGNSNSKNGDRTPDKADAETPTQVLATEKDSVVTVGNIEVYHDQQLGTGSNGTIVYAGKFDGREVAIKAMLVKFYDVASQETKLLRESDDHSNVIRYYSQQRSQHFLYIALERCAASLADVIERPLSFLELANAGRRDLPNILYQITNGISHLHSLRIVHRDLKPQNILVNMGKDGRPRMLVSDFGLCKKLENDQSSFGATTGRAAGTSGWRAPELLLDDDARDAGKEPSTHSGSGSVLVMDPTMSNRRATRAIDIFSLGLVFFYVLTNGSHPFDCGDRYMREVNIRKGNYNLRALEALGEFAHEAEDLIASMLQADPKQRPSAKEIMSHPFFWSAKKRLAFLCDVSDHFEKEPRDPPSDALAELESFAPRVTKGDFLRALPRDFVDSLGKQRKYTGSRLLDLLRALRNKRNHYEDMPDGLKKSIGALPDGYLAFWSVRFPMLLLVCWTVVYNVGWVETDRFREYYEPALL